MIKKILFLSIILAVFSTVAQSTNKSEIIQKKYDSILVIYKTLEKKGGISLEKENGCITDRITSLEKQETIVLKYENAKESPYYVNAQTQIEELSQQADSCLSSLSEKINNLIHNNIKKNDTLNNNETPLQISESLLKIKNNHLEELNSELSKSNGTLNSKVQNLSTELINAQKQREKLLYWFCAIALITFIYILLLVFKKIKQKKSIKDLNDNLNTKNKDIKSLENQTQQLLVKINSIKTVTQNSSEIELKRIFSPLSPLSNNKTPLFLAESFVTAGPRKNYIEQIEDGDIDLGEDVAGFLVKGNYAAFWVLDGTSGQDKLYSKEDDDRIQLGSQSKEYFSSRLLAQNIAWNLHSLIKQNGLEYSSFMLLKQAIEKTQTQWQENINNLKKEDKLELKQILEARNMVLCSTTVAFGIITMNKELDLTVSGDCVVITQPNPIEIPPNNRRQSANIYLKDGKIKVDFNDLKNSDCVIKNATGIEKVIAMSDGISKMTQKWISSSTNIDFTNPQIRESLARLEQKSMDDKSISIIQIIEK
ncbi:hypothetical protein KO506_14785 [Polaribacter vadi]|uniref:hypothetical protein n=1 Tax=Polaribacter TaxID=52959 RepID=UPI001C090A90|nr:MULTISPECIES: hypothetical protein [Polaribacter]MBU3012677.1 hypothetical protein [Polaribacter vadi]MDO6742494.1 hypothetical protein [Polaribacter sp. 1_MG-2023]